MRSNTLIKEVAAMGALLASYPLDAVARRAPAIGPMLDAEPVILAHGFGGSRSNLLVLAAYLRCAGFHEIEYFEYPRTQLISQSAVELGRMVGEIGGERGVHLVGHSLGGTIARWYARTAPRGMVRSLVTLGSPYNYSQWSPHEVAIFGDDDPIVPAPVELLQHPYIFGRTIVLKDTGHLALVYHPESLRIIATDLRANRAIAKGGVSAQAP